MTIAKAFSQGIRSVNGRKRLVFLFYGVTTIWAIAVAAPVMAILLASLGGSAWPERMTANFDVQWVAEMLVGDTSVVFAPAIAAGMLVFALAAIAHLFLIGGALELFRTEERFSLEAFMRGCGRHFWRFVRLALLAGVGLALLLVLNRGIVSIGTKIWGEGSVQGPLVHWSWFRMAVVLALFALGNLVFDYARVRMVAEDSRKAFRSLLAATRFVFANFGRTVSLYALVWLILLALVAIYWIASGAIGQTALAAVMVVFLLRQAMVLAKTWTQLLFASTETEMFRALTPVSVPAPVPEPPAVEPEPPPVLAGPPTDPATAAAPVDPPTA